MADQQRVMTDDDLVILFQGASPAMALLEFLDGMDSTAAANIGERSAVLHNQSKLDLRRLMGDPLLIGRKSWEIYEFNSFIDGAVATLDISPDEMVRFIPAVATRESDAGLPLGGFKRWCQADPTRWRSITDAAQAGDAATAPFVAIALQASDDLDVVAAFLRQGGDQRAKAIHALGWLSTSGDLPARSLALLEAELGGDDDVNAALLFSAACLLDHSDGTLQAQFEQFLTKAASSAGAMTAAQFARLPLHFAKLLTPTVVDIALTAFARIDLGDKRSVDHLDGGLGQLMRRGFHVPAIDFVTRLLSTEDIDLSLADFDDFSRELLASGLRDQTLVRWLLSGEPGLCRSLTSLVHSDQSEGPVLSIAAEHLDLPEAELGFLCRKAAGFLFHKQVTAASVLVAVLRVAYPAIGALACGLLFDPLLINFPGSVSRYLEAITEGDPAYEGARIALQHSADYEEGLGSARQLRELLISEDQRQTQHRIQLDESRRIQKEASEKSIFANLFTKKLVLHGRKVRSVVPDLRGGKPNVIETEMHGHGYSWELPRAEIADSLGVSYHLFRLRVERRPQ